VILNQGYSISKSQQQQSKQSQNDLREVPVNPSKFEHLKNISFTENLAQAPASVDIMIGLPWYNIIMGKPFEPMALPTKLGSFFN
jgi:hypothetical protein